MIPTNLDSWKRLSRLAQDGGQGVLIHDSPQPVMSRREQMQPIDSPM